MAKKKVPINEKVKTRKDEIRFKTDDPKRMLNKYEVLFEKGTYIDREVLQKIQFSQAAGECKEIEVSNQNREAYELESTHLYPYSSKVTVGDKKYRFILYATSIQNVLEIMRDYLELNYSGGFSITNVQEMDSCIILTDELTKENLDIAYLRDGIDMETYLNARQGPDESEDGNDKEEKKFFQMDMKITYDDGIELHQSFIVNTFDTNRALLVINKYLQDAEQKHADKVKENGGTYEKRKNVLCIEKAAPMPVKSFVPKEFSLAYNEPE